MPDAFQNQAIGVTGPLIGAFAISPDDAADLPQVTRQIRILGSGGLLSAVWLDGQSRAIPVQMNDVLDWRIVRVLATGTTATGVWGFY